MDSITIHGWQIPLVVKSSDETYGRTPPKSLPSMDLPSIHGGKISVSGMQHSYVLASWYIVKGLRSIWKEMPRLLE